MVRSATHIANPPGETIREQLLDRELTQKEFAARMELSEKHISRLINGEVQLTQDVAFRLEMVLGIPARFWNNLEALYREKLALVQAENDMETDISLAKMFPCRDMVQLGWISAYKTMQECVIQLRKFFEVASLSLLDDPRIIRIACRRKSITEKADHALLAWAQQAKKEARNIPTSSINISKLEKVIPELRGLTTIHPKEFCPKLVNLLSECGIALVFLPHIEGSFLHGATFYDGKKIVIGLTVRGKYADKFWFSLFHELAHILYGHINNSNGTTEDEEHQADAFSEETLIPIDKLSEFIKTCPIRTSSIVKFASDINIDPGIVIGRLQKDGVIPFSRYNNIKTQYKII